MVNSKSPAEPGHSGKDCREVVLLRWGHRPQRDVRLTTHVALAARAFGATGFILADSADEHLRTTLKKVTNSWGGIFHFEMGTSWKNVVSEWKKRGGIVVHLTVYGENIQTSNVLDKIRDGCKNVLLLVGSQKVPPEFYSAEVSDFNVAIGNQPHSECAAVSVFLDRFFEGKELSMDFENAKMQVVPQARGKYIKTDHEL